MIIWGWGKRTVKHWGQITQTCPYCKNTGWFQVVTIRTWFTIFFIPVIPYRVKHAMMCSNCGGAVELDAQRVAMAQHVIAGGTVMSPMATDADGQLAAARARDAAYLQSVSGDAETQGTTPTEADRLRARLENRNSNWDDRR